MTDLNDDGVAEVTVPYKLFCAGDVEESVLKIIMRVGGAKVCDAWDNSNRTARRKTVWRGGRVRPVALAAGKPAISRAHPKGQRKGLFRENRGRQAVSLTSSATLPTVAAARSPLRGTASAQTKNLESAVLFRYARARRDSPQPPVAGCEPSALNAPDPSPWIVNRSCVSVNARSPRAHSIVDASRGGLAEQALQYDS